MPDSVGADDESATRPLCASTLQSPQSTFVLTNSETPVYSTVREHMISKAVTIRVLDLSSTIIGSPGASKLVDVLRFCSSLRVLNLSGNLIKCKGARIIAAVLPECEVLTDLNLQDNVIGPYGAVELAPKLPLCASLEKVDLSYNLIGYTGACSFARILHECSCLRKFDLSRNGFGDTGAELFTFASNKQCMSLNRLDLSVNNISLTRQKILADNVLPRCPNLHIENLVLRGPTS